MSGLEEQQLDKLRSVRAVTLRQIESADLIRDNLYRIDGKDIDQITFVGNVTQITILPAAIDFEIEDGTGIVSIKKWMPPSDDDPDFTGCLQGIKEGSYVRVCGGLRVYKNKPNVVAYTVNPIKSGNEMMYHLLEAVAQHLHITRGPYRPPCEMQIDGNDGQATQQPPASQYHASAAGQKIMDYLTSLADGNMLPADGVQDSIIAQMTGLSRRVVADQIWKLYEQGAVYHGHDENHVFPTAT